MAEAHDSTPKRPLPPPNRRRDKPQLSCNVCRSRKLKCDREQPCGGCQRRGISNRCIYVTSNISTKSSRNREASSKAANNNGSENLFPSVPHAEAEHEQILPPETFNSEVQNTSRVQSQPVFSPQHGNIHLSYSETIYVDSSHWTAILDKTVGLKSTLHVTDNGVQEPKDKGLKVIYDSGETDILFGTYQSLNSHQVLAAMPSREIADQLITQYFSQGTLASVILHNSTFLKQYNQFWAKPADTSIIWVGLLFAVMSLGKLSQQQRPEDFENHQIVRNYRERIGQSLVLGRYTKCPPFTIETLLLLLYIDYAGQRETQMKTWVLLGTVVQLSFRAGYHRDPSNFPEISPFDREMRRRVWASLVQSEALLSTQFGAPGMIKNSLCDTIEPLNLLDEDLNENMTAPPTARNDSLYTPTQFLVAKTKLARVQRKIIELTESIKPPAYSEVMRLDTSLNNIYSSIPDGLKMLPRNHALVDTSENTIRRIDMSTLYQRARCNLHHRYMVAGAQYIPYEYSRSTCVEAALQILEYQHTLNLETPSNRKLYQERWKVPSFVSTSFYFAATLLCLILKDGFNQVSESNTANLHLKRKIVDSLNTSYKIWNPEKGSSMEARKIAEALETVLGKGEERSLGDLVDGSMVEDGGSVTNDPTFGNLISQAPSYLNFTQLEVSSRVETNSLQSNVPQNPMSMHVLMELNDRAGVDYSGTEAPRQPPNHAPPPEDLSDISMGFPRMFGFANDGVRTVFGGNRED